MSDYLEEFRARMRKINEEYAADMLKFRRDDCRAMWVLGSLLAVCVIAEIVIAVARS